MNAASYVIWIAGPAMQLVLAAVMLRRGLRRRFPVFFWYVVAQTISFVPQFVCFRISYTAYYWSYWAFSFISVTLGFMVIREVFIDLMRPYDYLRDLGDVLFRWASLVLVLVAIVSAVMSSVPGVSRTTVGILAVERGVRVMQCGMVLFMLLFSSHLGLTVRHHCFAVALGFGLFAAVELITVTITAMFGYFQPVALSMANSITYMVSIALWICYLSRPEPERMPIDARTQTERWNMALAGVQNVIPQESFMTAVEDAVERVLSRRDSESRH